MNESPICPSFSFIGNAVCWFRSFTSIALRSLGVAMLLLSCSFAWSQPIETPHAEVELLAQETAVRPGQPITLALSIKHAAHWHTYWKNPGDAGVPTQLAWSLPQGYEATGIDWPTPQRIPFGPMVSFGYTGDTLLPVTVKVPATAVLGEKVALRAKATWLVCNEMCIPEEGEVAITLPVATASAPSPSADRISKAVAELPVVLSDWSAKGVVAGRLVLLTLVAPAAARSLSELYVFPSSENVTDPSIQKIYRTADGYAALLQLAEGSKFSPEFPLLLTSSNGAISQGKRAGTLVPTMTQVASIELPAGAVLLGQPSASKGVKNLIQAAPNFTLLSALGLAFLGGLVLNLMPCVFPVLSLKILGFAHHAGEGKVGQIAMRKHGLAYAAGVVLSFISLAAVLLALRAGGDAVGWGFQLQSPGVVWVLAVIFFAIGLNLMGAFEIGQLAPSSLLSLQAKRPGVDAFLGGVLAVIAASPCTAPFMGAALGFAVTQSAWVALSVFAALGVGMALPYVLLAWFPAWLRRLPRPGQWMVSFKQLLAFPMFVTVAWLVWVLALQAGIDGAVMVLLGLIGLALAAWFCTSAKRPMQLVGLAVAVFSVAWAWPVTQPTDTSAMAGVATRATTTAWQTWSPERVAELTAQGKPVFVDFTAAWCVSCQANKKLVLATADIQSAFADRGVVLLRADWTNRDERISRALTELGRSGVPAYVLHSPKAEPVVLPELLTTGIVMAALAAL